VTSNRLWAGAALLAALGGVAALAVADRSEAPVAARPPAERPTLALLTSLPLLFGESFSLDSGGSPALTRLDQRYKVVPIGVADAASLNDQTLLLMAHPRAQPAEALAELDQWVRGGGRVLLLADPRLDWPSARPVGDRLRPPPAFADTGLLAHWEVRLSGPDPSDATSAGRLESRRCQISADGLVAHCAVGKGHATIIADADFLNGEPQGLDLLIAELARLESR
jgi:hypothetical protein